MKLRILIQLIGYNIGGTERRFANILKASVEYSKNEYFLVINRYLYNMVKDLNWFNGLKNKIIIVPDPLPLLGFNIDYPQPRKRLPWLVPIYDLIIKTFNNPKRILSVVKPDLIHIATRMWWNFFPDRLPRLVEVQNNLPESVHEPYISYHIKRKNCYFNVASESIMRNLIRTYPFIKDRVFHIPFTFTDLNKIIISNKDKIITYLGKFNDVRGVMLGIEAAIKTCQINKDVIFYFIGHGIYEKDIKKIIKDHGLEKRIIVLNTGNPFPILAKTSIYLALAKYDNYHSQALLEAMASKCAVVATDVGETSKIVNDHVGVRVPPDPNVISKIINQLIKNPKLLKFYRENARNKVLKEYSVEKYINLLDNIYKSVIERSR